MQMQKMQMGKFFVFDSTKEKGKMIMAESRHGYETRCRRHPSKKHSMGVCSICLKERLDELFCPDCGEQRQRHSNGSASSCSCSEASTSASASSSCADFTKKKSNSNNDNGGGSVEVGSVGRISFLIDSDRPEFEASKAEAAILLLRRSKSAACSTTRTAAVAKLDPQTPKTPGKKAFTIWSFFLFKKRRKVPKSDAKEDNSKDCPRSSVSSNSDRIVVESRLVKSRSVGFGRRSFSGYSYIWENHNNVNKAQNGSTVFCTPSTVNELQEVESSNLGGAEDSQKRRRSGRGWSWAFASPMRAFKHHHSQNGIKKTINKADTAPSPVILPTEMCRG